MKKIKNIFKNSGIRSLTEDQDSLFRRFMYIFRPPKNKFFTINNVGFLGWSLAVFLQKKYGRTCNILIGTDTRISGQWIKKRLLKGMNVEGHHIFDAGIVPTPFIAQAIKNKRCFQTQDHFFQLGIVITASHNPAEYNGIKILTPQGYLSVEEEMYISNIFHNILSPEYSPSSIFPQIISSFDAISFYQTEIQKHIAQLSIPSDVKIVLDCSNGATSSIAKKIFYQYCTNIITINDQGDGSLINKNSGCSNTKLLIQAIQKHNAAWGCAFDGDGDRVIIANNNGEIFDGDDILVVLSQHQMFVKETTFVGTIMTNNAIQQHYEQNDKTLIRTDVGERNIIEALKQHHAQLGSETCGHITVMNHAYCSDGIFAALLFFETIFAQPQVLKNLPKKFTQLHANVQLNLILLKNMEIEKIVFEMNQTILPGRIIARASNTEPLFRITIEHPNIEIANQIMNKIKSRIVKIN